MIKFLVNFNLLIGSVIRFKTSFPRGTIAAKHADQITYDSLNDGPFPADQGRGPGLLLFFAS